MVIGQKGSRQNGTDKMVCINITYKMVLNKMVWTESYGQNGSNFLNKLFVPFCPYHFVHNILSVTFYLLPFCPKTVTDLLIILHESFSPRHKIVSFPQNV